MASKNVTSKVVDNKLVIEVDLSVQGEPSSTGKSLVIGSTGGFANIDGMEGFKFGLNVIGPLKK